MVLCLACEFCVLYFIFCSKYSIFDQNLTYLNIFFSSFIVSKSRYLSPWKVIVECWKESTATKTHVKQPHFYPIISYHIQKLSIRQYYVLAFLKKYLTKTCHTWTHKITSLSFHLSITFLHEGFRSWKQRPLQQGGFIIVSFMVFTTETFFEVAIEGWPDSVGWIFSLYRYIIYIYNYIYIYIYLSIYLSISIYIYIYMYHICM